MSPERGPDHFLKGGELERAFSRKTWVMGVLNVTPDSFSDGGFFFDRDRAVAHALEMVQKGADIIDVGGESTRPYSERVSLQEELDRVVPVIERLSRLTQVPISIDTFKAEVAREALRAGAAIINDISSLRFDPQMITLAAESDAPIILMHMKGTPGTMQENPAYGDVVAEVMDFLRERMRHAMAGGIRRERIILDPGIGFGKTVDHNLMLLRDLDRFLSLERPLLVGTSNKAFLGRLLNKAPQERTNGTLAAVAAAVLKGASIVRVHDVGRVVETVTVIDAIKRGREG